MEFGDPLRDLRVGPLFFDLPLDSFQPTAADNAARMLQQHLPSQ